VASISFAKRDAPVRKEGERGVRTYFAERQFFWANLPGTLREVERLKSEVFTSGDGETRIYHGEDASEARLKSLSAEGRLADYPYVILSAHGYFDNVQPEMSCVVLSDVSEPSDRGGGEDGYLTIAEAAVLNLRARMVSLSACETGMGGLSRGDGVVGLARAFLVAGAEGVGVSLWRVADEATGEFMVRVYRKVVKEGMDFAMAYQAAKEEFRVDPEWKHPYYWAAFTMYE
jgi:CHAT domain-containing protein